REGGRGDRERRLDVAAPGLEAPPGPERGRARQLPGGGAAPALQPGARTPPAVPRLAPHVRARAGRAARSDGCISQGTPTARRAAMTPSRHGSSVIEFPSELEIVTTRAFEAPLDLVFDVLTSPEPVRTRFDALTRTRTGGS